ncbi:hypothetical protein [Pedobacter soli]|uniref:Uncharacterized protein n=1 Tax=Pedobacter soli TaxID=390242 RepID=A0A1G6Y6B0_9SPHI|nr:hypothetical protein [Pedobacter soli]SDD85890.1 hypothetical protein SAMN04488024_108172 [Pedobacter soli]
MNALEEINQKFDLDVLSKQLKSAVDSKDPLGYMRSNINWEIDKDLDIKPNLEDITSMMSESYSTNISYEMWDPFRKFLDWLNRNKTANQIKNILCKINAEIQKLIDEEAKLKEIIGIALTAIAARIGIEAISSMILTLVVGFLTTMILKGAANFCGI